MGDIPKGVKVAGTINILGYEVKCDFEMSKEYLKLMVEMGPIEWANGNIQIRRTEGSSEGPMVDIYIPKVRPTLYFTFY